MQQQAGRIDLAMGVARYLTDDVDAHFFEERYRPGAVYPALARILLRHVLFLNAAQQLVIRLSGAQRNEQVRS